MKRTRRDLSDAITREWRAAQSRADAFDETVAEAIGVNRTDLRCLDVLDQQGATTAGRLADLMGLTSGATTAVVDRLERLGYVRRVRDTGDRRRVYVEPTPLIRERTWPLYEPLARMGEELYAPYPVADLEVVLDFLERAAALSEGQLERLRERIRPAD